MNKRILFNSSFNICLYLWNLFWWQRVSVLFDLPWEPLLEFVSKCSLAVVFLRLCPCFTFLSGCGSSILMVLSQSSSLFLLWIPDFAILGQVWSSALACWFFLFAFLLDVCYRSEVLTKQWSFITLAQTHIHVTRLCWRKVLRSKYCLLRVWSEWCSFTKACNLVRIIWMAEHFYTFFALIVSNQLLWQAWSL